MDPIESIFHERQEGSLCAQHCLNALLQGHYFTAVELADIAQQLDDREREHMAEGGIQTAEYQQFMQQPSSNFDDSGFFSVQVIANALRVWNLELLPFNSTDAISVQARENPTQQTAFICNFREHWFCVRKLGYQWFNLNSLLSGPELISDTYLAMFLTQLQQEGYDLFLVIGELPSCDGDEILKVVPAEQRVKPSLITDKPSQEKQSGETTEAVTDDALERALAESRNLIEQDDKVLQRTLEMSRVDDEEEKLLQRALQMSMEGASSSPASGSEPSTSNLSAQELRERRLAFLERGSASKKEEDLKNTSNNAVTTETPSGKSLDEKSEEEILQEAINLSMQQS